MDAISNFFVTGASGQLGRIVVQLLADRGFNVIAGMRDPAKGADLAALGAEVRAFDYDNPASLASAVAGADRLLLISSSEVGKRVTQHQAVIDAACTAGVAFIAYTSILRATETPIGLASEHRATEALIQQSGIAHAFLRNGWYCENFMMGLTPAIQHGALMTCANQARFSAATRADFAAGAVAVLTKADPEAASVYELAGSTSFSMEELAMMISDASGREIAFVNVPEAQYAEMLISTGMPEPFARSLAETDTLAGQGWLQDDSRTLEQLIGRPTTPISALLSSLTPTAA